MQAGAHGISPEDHQEITSVVKAYESCWNRHEMESASDLFADDAHWINIVGMHWVGKPAVVAAHKALHDTFFRTIDQELMDLAVRGIAPGVAVAVAHFKMGAFTPPDGAHRPAAGNRLSFILTRKDEGWRIAHGHNCVVDPAAQPFDPLLRA